MAGRVQAPELQGNRTLKPAPVQSDTYAPPPRVAQDDRYARLASALSSFSGSIGNLASAMKPTAEEKQEAEWAAQRKFAGRTREEWAQAVESGEMPAYANDFERKAIESISGAEYGAHRGDQIRQHLMTEFDWDNEDLDEYLKTTIAEDLEKYGQSRLFGPAYLRQMESVRTWALDYAEKRKTEGFLEEKSRAAFGWIDTQVDGMIKEGNKTPEEIAKSVYDQYRDLGKEGTLGLDYDALDKEVLNKARRLASTDPEVALAILAAERDGRGGKMSLLQRGEFRDTVIAIQGEAAKAISAREEAAYRAQVLENDVDLFIKGDADRIDDHRFTSPDGKEHKLTKQERIDRAREEYLRRSRGVAQFNREAPQETMKRELRAFRLSGEKHPALESMVTGMADMASPDMLQDPEARQKLLDKVNTYKWMQNESKNSTIAYTDEKDREFAETFLLSQKYLGYDDDRALLFAIETSQPMTKEGQANLFKQQSTIESEVNNLGTEGWIFQNEPANWSVVSQRVTILANRFVRGGVKPDKAVSMAAEAIRNTSLIYNDVVMDVQGLDIPDNFKDIADEVIADYAKNSAATLERLDLDEDDISLMPVGSTGSSGGRFKLIDKETLQPVIDNEGNGVFITLGDIRRRSQVKQREADNRVLQDASVNASAKAKGLKKQVNDDGVEEWINPKTREVFILDTGDGKSKPVFKKSGRRLKKGKGTTPREIDRINPANMHDRFSR